MLKAAAILLAAGDLPQTSAWGGRTNVIIISLSHLECLVMFPMHPGTFAEAG